MSLSKPLQEACGMSELQVFAPQSVQVEEDEGRFVTFASHSTLSNAQVIEVLVPPSESEATDLSHTSIKVKVQVQLATGANIATGTNDPWLTHMAFQALFKEVVVLVNQQVITPQVDFPYKTFLQVMTEFEMEENTGQAVGMHYYKDDAGKADTAAGATAGTHNTSAVAKRALVADSATLELVGPLLVDQLLTSRLLIPGADITFRLVKNDADFIIVDTAKDNGTYKVNIIDFALSLRRVKLDEGVQKEMKMQILKTPAVYPFIQRNVVKLAIIRGLTSFRQENIFRGFMPQKFIVAMVDESAANGNIKKSATNFQDFGLSQIGFYADGVPIGENEPLKVDISGSDSLGPYFHLLKNVGAVGEKPHKVDISFKEFKSGSTIFIFNRSPDMTISDCANPRREGNISCKMLFKTGVPANIQLIIMALSEATYSINHMGQVSTDYVV